MPGWSASMNSIATNSIRRKIVLAVLVATGTSLLLLVLPIYTTGSGSYSVDSHGEVVSGSSSGRATILAVNGPRGLIGLVIPPILALAPVLVPGQQRQRRAAGLSAIALTVFVLLAGFSIGMFYLPAALAMIWAAAQPAGRQAAA